MKTAQRFLPDVNSIPAARRFVLAAIGPVPAEQRDAVSVMVSELAMNAVEHARTRFQVTVEITNASLRVEVTDSGGGIPAPRPLPDPASLRGRGLFIVSQLSDAWGNQLISRLRQQRMVHGHSRRCDQCSSTPTGQHRRSTQADRLPSPSPCRRPDSQTPPARHGHRVSPSDLLASR